MLRPLTISDPAFIAQSAVAPFTPASFPGLWGWYDATTIVGLSDGDNVTAWADLSGNANNLSTIGGAEPTYKTSIFGSNAAVRFDGASDYLILPSVTFGPTGWCIIAVTKGITADSMLLGNSAVNRQIRINRAGANTCSIYDGIEYVSGAFPTAVAAARATFFDRNPAPASALACEFYNNKALVSAVPVAGAFSATCDRVGVTSYGNYFAGDLGELIIYNADYLDPTTGVAELFDNYLQAKWGL